MELLINPIFDLPLRAMMIALNKGGNRIHLTTLNLTFKKCWHYHQIYLSKEEPSLNLHLQHISCCLL
jgi:hypothetical protein